MTQVDERIGLLLDQRYRLVAVIGVGGSARVYLADDLRLKRQVAVKILHSAQAGDERLRRRFEAEARSVAAFTHPHLVTVHDWGESPDGPYLVTEYLSGGSLRDLLDAGLAENRLLSPAQAVKIGYETAAGLAAAHERGMVHRDIKPANLLFDQNGLLRVADFGLVQVLDEVAITEPDGMVLGTASYVAPERGMAGPVDGRTDVYSLALTLVEAVTGSVPLAGGNVTEMIVRRRDNDIEVPDLFGPAASVIARAGAADPSDRPTAIELRDELIGATRGFAAPNKLRLPGALPAGAPEFKDVPVFDAEATSVQDGTEVIPREVGVAPTPSWRPTWKLMTLVALVLGGLAAVAAYRVSTVEPQQTPTHLIDSYVGRTIEDVRALASVNGWVVDEDQIRSNDVDTGLVTQQNPGPGVALAEGELLSVEIAVGPLLVMTPFVIGSQDDAATARLEARQFVVVNREPMFDENIPAGQVMELRIDGVPASPGLLLEPGTEVEFVVSGGPVPRTVENLVGLTIEEATARTLAQRLVLTEEERVFSEDIPEGVVVSQSIFPGLQTERDTEVVVVVSKGQDRRIVPDVAGMTIAEATRAFETVGLVRSGVSGSGDLIESTEPAIGTPLPPGSEVLLWAPAS
ncbi:MAG: beta-lactam-binding protein with PASTA domain [Candidatus Poriferisodalaceae bacterium]|jgi:eukaryotic-like serine/threonine-protein kinase